MAWVYILTAGLFEFGFTFFLKMSEGFTKPWPTIGSIIGLKMVSAH